MTGRYALLRFTNNWAKPGPVFNFMMKAAFLDGADYLYRVNDDTEMRTSWAASGVTTLQVRLTALSNGSL